MRWGLLVAACSFRCVKRQLSFPQQWATFARAWYLLDARMQPPGKIAAVTAVRLEGRHKPIYHALSDCGDHVVIINTRHIAFSGNKWEQKVYSSHSGYPGGFKQVTATQLHMKDPTAIVKLTIYRMLPKNLQRRTMMQRLHLFPDDVFILRTSCIMCLQMPVKLVVLKLLAPSMLSYPRRYPEKSCGRASSATCSP
ncbi:39S ribosomal protein L13, mitochondrial isoform X1 [Apteryx rowi]|uniref:39S ribosomal protein L13, mitochondrial isoform X1 n=1 Tax=Apteryx rowi TaxID=308060 RepID=UPI000E1C9D15|nr:39S ribosomal protein L13, mitochondrial isoform X1 [Apteryx rowi]